MSLYEFFNFLSGVALLGFNMTQVNEKKLFLGRRTIAMIRRLERTNAPSVLKKYTFWAGVEIFLFFAVQYLPTPVLNKTFGDLVGTGANYFGMLFSAPIFLGVVCLALWIEPLRQIDALTPAFPFALAIAKLGCFCAGCCDGIKCDLGFYTEITGRTTFPAQLLESAVAITLFFALIWNAEHLKKGTLFPVYLISYSAIRFFTEFLREEPTMLLGLKRYQYLCIVGVVLGLLEYFCVVKFGNKISNRFESDSLQTT